MRVLPLFIDEKRFWYLATYLTEEIVNESFQGKHIRQYLEDNLQGAQERANWSGKLVFVRGICSLGANKVRAST